MKYHATKVNRLISLILALFLTLGLCALPVFAEGENARGSSGEFTSVGPSASGTTYYVDGAKGNDNYNGTSPTTPWRSLNKVNATTFLSGDHILLNSGSVWNNQMLFPKGSGSVGNPIVVDLYTTDTGGNVSYSADKRPIINANGTFGIGTKKTMPSGAIMTYNQEYIEFRNLEVSNSENLSDPNAYKKAGTSQRSGILMYSDNQDKIYDHIVIKDCYVHDVQGEYYFKPIDGSVGGLKSIGGIIILGHHLDPNGNLVARSSGKSTAGYKNVLIEGNVVRRVGLEGIRTKCNSNTSMSGNTFNKVMSDIIIRNNYLEDIAGDGIVLTEVFAGGIVENNISKQACNADYGAHNYAGIWSMYSDDALFQNNEVYGIVYGYNDGEAFDIDMSCTRNTYQYNYSHHNSGGFFLFMGNQYDSIVRYNISANDGGGSRGIGADGGAGNTYNYKEQSIFHYWNKADNNTMPTIYNNTFFVGDGVSTSLYGEGNASSNAGVRARFYNNILYKEGSGSLKLLANQPSNGSDPVERKLGDNPEKYMQNNIFWPASLASVTSGATPDVLALGKNIIADPKLMISQSPSGITEFAEQNNTIFDVNGDDIYEFTSTERIRERASIFKIAADSPAIAKGRAIENSLESDFFGNSTKDIMLDIGAHQLSSVEYKTEVESVATVNIATDAGSYPNLPKMVSVTFKDIVGSESTTRTEDVGITWEIIPLAKYQSAGSFTVNGKLNIKQDYTVTATIVVNGTVSEGDFLQSIPATEDSFIQGDKTAPQGTVQGKIVTSGVPDLTNLPLKYPLKAALSDNYVLKIKNSNSAGYNRRFLVKFNVEDFEGDWSGVKNASIELHIARYDLWNNGPGTGNSEKLANNEYYLDVYPIDSNVYPGLSTSWTWSENAVIWNNAPLNAKITEYNHPGIYGTPGIPDYSIMVPQAHNHILNRTIIANNDTISIDVSKYMQNLDNSIEEVSFIISMPNSTLAGYDLGNSGFDAFSKEGAAAAFKAYEENKLPQGIVVDSETSLAPNLIISDIYQTTFDPINIEVALGATTVDLPATINLNYSNGDTKPVGIIWDTVSLEKLKEEGTFVVRGYTNVTAMPVEANVTVVAKKIVSFLPLESIDIARGKARNELGLATQAIGILEDSSQVIVPITAWEDSQPPYSSGAPVGEFVFAAGGYDLPVGVVITGSAKPSQIVTTHPSPVSIKIEEGAQIMAPGDEAQFREKITYDVEVNDPWSAKVIWSINADVSSGVTVDNTGKIKVADTAVEGTYILKVQSAINSNIFATMPVAVTTSEEEVLAVEIQPITEILSPNSTISLVSKVIHTGNADIKLVWDISGSNSLDTKISSDGVLTIGEEETSEKIIVTARAVANGNIFASIEVNIAQDYTPKVTAVKISPATIGLEQGESYQFSAAVTATNGASEGINWQVTGANSAGTAINSTGMLTIDAAETATSITVKAVSGFDSAISDQAIVTVHTTGSAFVRSLLIVPNTVEIKKGESHSFRVVIDKDSTITDDTASFELLNGASLSTFVDIDGKVSVGDDETARTLILKATSNADSSVSNQAIITVIENRKEIVSYAPISKLRAYIGMHQQNIGLPKKVVATLDDNTTIELEVESWYSTPIYDRYNIGVYEFKGYFNLIGHPEIANSALIMPTLQVSLENSSDNNALGMLIAEANIYVSNGVVSRLVPSKKTDFDNALAKANAVVANEYATQTEIQSAYTSLMSAIWNLGYEKADKAQLENLYNRVKGTAFTGLTQESVNLFKEKLANAKTILDNAELSVADQSVINSAKLALEQAFAGLTPVQINKEALKAMIDRIASLKEENYTKDSWQQLVAVVNTGRTVLNKVAATQSEVDKAAEDIQLAINGLVVKENKLEVEKLLNIAGNLIEKDYTENSWKNLLNAIAKAKELLASSNITQAQLDNMAKELQQAIDGLVKVGIGVIVNPGGNTGNGSSGTGTGSSGSSKPDIAPEIPGKKTEQTKPTEPKTTTGAEPIKEPTPTVPKAGSSLGTGGGTIPKDNPSVEESTGNIEKTEQTEQTEQEIAKEETLKEEGSAEEQPTVDENEGLQANENEVVVSVPEEEKEGLSTGAVVVIVIASLAALGGLATLTYFKVKKK